MACVEVASGPVARAVVHDPVVRDAGFLAEVDHPSFGRHRRLAPLVTLSLTPAAPGPAPLLGQHTDAVLRELGFADEAIAALAAAGVIRRAGDAARAAD